MILSFDEFIKINESGTKSIVTLSELRKTIEPFGWEFSHSSGGDNIKVSKGKFVNSGHLEHGNSSDNNRLINIAFLSRLRKMFIQEFIETGDLSLIKNVDWNKWRLLDPLKKELKDYDPETGNKIEVPEEKPKLNVGQKLQQAKVAKSISKANKMYKDAGLWKIDNNSETSAYIMSMYDENYKKNIYNTCRSIEDRRPILKEWTYSYQEKEGKYYFGKDNMRTFMVNYKMVLPDGNLDKDISFSLDESLKY